MQNYSLNGSFIVGNKYKYDDPAAIFECIVCKRENGEIKKELLRMFGKHLSKTFLSAYMKLHKLSEKLHIITNIVYDKQAFVYDAIYDTNELESELLTFNKMLENNLDDHNTKSLIM